MPNAQGIQYERLIRKFYHSDHLLLLLDLTADVMYDCALLPIH